MDTDRPVVCLASPALGDGDATFVVIPASAPGSIAGKGNPRHRQMDPGTEAGMTMEPVATVETPTKVMSDLNRTAVGLTMCAEKMKPDTSGSRPG